MKIVYLEWEDACSRHDWVSEDHDYKTMSVKSIGWVVKEDKDKIVISTSFTTDKDFADPIIIPKKWISSRKNLTKDILS